MADYSDWQILALHDLEHTDLSYQETGDKYGRSRDTIIKLKERHQVVRRLAKRFPEKFTTHLANHRNEAAESKAFT